MKRDDFYSLHISSQEELNNIVDFFAQYPRYQGRIKISVEPNFFKGDADSQILLESNLIITDSMNGANAFYNTSTANERSSLLMLIEYLAENHTALPVQNTGETYSYYYFSNEMRVFNHTNITGNTPVLVFKDKTINALSLQEYDYYFIKDDSKNLVELFECYDSWYGGTFHMPMSRNSIHTKYVDHFLSDILSYEGFNARKQKKIISESIKSQKRTLIPRI